MGNRSISNHQLMEGSLIFVETYGNRSLRARVTTRAKLAEEGPRFLRRQQQFGNRPPAATDWFIDLHAPAAAAESLQDDGALGARRQFNGDLHQGTVLDGSQI